MPQAYDIRGIEPLGGYSTRFGQGCSGAFGTVTLDVTGRVEAGRTVTTVSDHHSPNAAGVLLIGFSKTVYAGFPLPLNLDPLLLTNGCSLLVSVDGTLNGASGASTPATLQIPIAIPGSVRAAEVHFQHLCLEGVPGNSSWSDAVSIHIR